MLFSILVCLSFLPGADDKPFEYVAGQPGKGFHSPYLLAVPPSVKGKTSASMLVIPNNTGSIHDDSAFHQEKAERTITRINETMGESLKVIVLVPIFPRAKKDWRIYTQALDRDTMLSDNPVLRRPDLQLVAMIDHARETLKSQGMDCDSRVLMFGFSASGMFTNRFVFLQPHRVKAAAFGSPGGWPIAPVAKEKDKLLRYPIGTGDWEKVTGQPFDLKVVADVPMFLFMGDKDNNDSVTFRDSYESEDEKLIGELWGKTPMSRWPLIEKLYQQHLPKATVKLYPGAGHMVSTVMRNDVIEFFQKHLSSHP